MKSYKKQLLGIVTLLLFISCSSSLWDDLPSPIASFITQYYPGVAISAYNDANSTYHVTVKNGPTMVFNEDYKWTTINGEGVALPQVLLFNEMPPSLYNYLSEGEMLNDVFVATRNRTDYTLTLKESQIIYNIGSGDIKQIR